MMEIETLATWAFAMGVPAWLVVEELVRRYGMTLRVKRVAPGRAARKPRPRRLTQPRVA
jgi:hypothetical protein